MSKAKIYYGDIAPDAKENFVAEAQDIADFVNLSQLQVNDLRVGNYANPCEKYQTLLDGSMEVFPQQLSEAKAGFWSNSLSDERGRFEEPIELRLRSQGVFASSGITLTFDVDNNIYCTYLSISWHYNGEEVSFAEFNPDAPIYFCENKVDYYDELVITFYEMNMPLQRMKLRSIEYGRGITFSASELKDVKLIQQIDPISETIYINTCDFTLNANNDIEYFFQKKQPLKAYFDGNLLSTVFIESAKRQNKNTWKISAGDYFSILDNITFMGGIYDNIYVGYLLDEIFNQTNVPHHIDEEIYQETVRGYIPICSCREAIQRICFACGLSATTANIDYVNISKLPNYITEDIAASKIKQNPSYEYLDKVTEIQITQHEFVKSTEQIVLFDASNGVDPNGELVFVEFPEPIYNLIIMGSGTIESSGTNFAYITAYANTILKGYRYVDKKQVAVKQNQLVLSSDLQNIKTISDQYLVSADNIDNVLNMCYNYYTGDLKADISIFERTYDYWTTVGDVVSVSTDYLGNVTGRIISQRFNLNGGLLLKKTELVRYNYDHE